MSEFKLSTLTLATAVAAAVAAPAVAQDWSGAYVGGSAGYTWGNANAGTDATTNTYSNEILTKAPPKGVVSPRDINYFNGTNGATVRGVDIPEGGFDLYDLPIIGNSLIYRESGEVYNIFTGLKNAAAAIGSQSFDPSGGDVALHAGYRWQTGNMVYGAELGYAFRDLDDGAFNIGNTATVRGTLGVDVNGTLLFGALGLSSADVSVDTGYYKSSGNETGFNIGVGAERMIASNWSLRGEVIYTDFGSQSFSHAESFDPGSATLTGAGSGEWDLSTTEVRVGLNYQF